MSVTWDRLDKKIRYTGMSMANNVKMLRCVAKSAKMVAGLPIAGGLCISGSGGDVLWIIS